MIPKFIENLTDDKRGSLPYITQRKYDILELAPIHLWEDRALP